MNFGESLAYWYFRLNGFIPMPNFVLHEVDAPRKHNADADLIAIRFPHVFEEVGGQIEDWDNQRFQNWGIDLGQDVVCVLCETKTGAYSATSINRAFSEKRLLYALRRFGVMSKEQCKPVCQSLMTSGIVQSDSGFSFVKVLLCSTDKENGGSSEMTPCCKIELSEAVKFIRTRMKKYCQQKHAARMFFPGDLIQFLAWEAGLPIANVLPGNEE